MPVDMYGDVVLTRDVPEREVRAGDVGTVVARHVVPGVSEAGYSVEFSDMAGNTAVARLHARSGVRASHRLPSLAGRRLQGR